MPQAPTNVHIPGSNFGSEEAERAFFVEQLRARAAAHATYDAEIRRAGQTYSRVLEALDRDGCVILKAWLPLELLSAVKSAQDHFVDTGTGLLPPRDLPRAREGQHFSAVPRIPIEDLTRGPDHYRHRTNTVDVARPLMSCPRILDIVLQDALIGFVGAYLGCLPALTYIKLRRSFVNRLPAIDTNFFHVDGGTLKPIRVFVYLADVGSGAGPFCYVRGSHRQKFARWKTQDRWTREEIVQHYGESAVMPLTAELGDVIVADNSGFHRGEKPLAADRSALLLTYSLHREYQGGEAPEIGRDTFDGLPPKAHAVLELLRTVP